MTSRLAQKLRGALEGSPLAPALAGGAAPLIERRSKDAAVARLADGPLLGLARVVASRPQVGGFLSHRPALLERISHADGESLAARGRELAAGDPPADDADLEIALDALRLRRREETCFAACLDLGGVATFQETSRFLSILAESIARSALALAERSPRGAEDPQLAVIGMGKIAGREFTYHSDLDLIFLYAGGLEAMAEAARRGQRLIAYLGTMTGAGVAYAVDARLRPSGRQGTLVTSLEAFERYQCESAETWEHLAVLRARAIAGREPAAQATLDRTRRRLLAEAGRPWDEIAQMRRQVERERAREDPDRSAFKTGPGGLMDVDFLAAGAILETRLPPPPLPGTRSMLESCLPGGRAQALVRDYEWLRRVESRARWCAGRAVEEIDFRAPSIAQLAELVESGLSPGALREALAACRRRVRTAFDAVVDSGTIRALPG